MKLQTLLVPIVFGLAAGAMVQATTINISGHVVNAGGTGLAGAKVALLKQNISALSIADGSFTLSGTTGILSGIRLENRGVLPYRAGNSIVFENASAEPVGVRVVGLSGKAVISYTERLPAGTYRLSPLSLLKGTVPAAGIYFVNVSIGGESKTLQFSSVIFSNGSVATITASNTNSGASATPQGLEKSLEVAVDTLVGSLSGYDTTKLAITDFTGTYSLTLTMPGDLPSAVTNLQLVNQGGSNNGSSPLTNYQKIGWTAATPGAYPIATYIIYRNGVVCDSSTATSYTDTKATNSNVPDYHDGATVYAYQVAAEDTHGNIGPQAAQMSVYCYYNGYSNWGNNDLDWGGCTSNYASTAGNPQGGPYDIAIVGNSGGFQPTAHAPQSPVDDLEIGAFNYCTVDINPGSASNLTIYLSITTRLPPGDVFAYSDVGNILAPPYGPVPKANTWATYRIPLTTLTMGSCNFTGSISGTTLTVTSIQSAAKIVDAGGFVTGNGIPAGTYILSHNQNASIGTFGLGGPGINSSISVPSGPMVYQRTALYKTNFIPSNGTVTWYINNLGYTLK